jgi:hypothetical protein
MISLRTIIVSALLGLTIPALAPVQAMSGNTYKADAAILSAGSRAAAIARLENVPSVGVVNLKIRFVPMFRSNQPDVATYRISVGKNAAGIKRLRAALAANPATARALASHGISIGRVVGVDIYSNGSIRVYVL